MYKIQIKDRNYSSFSIINMKNNNIENNIINDFCPIKYKLFNNDEFIFNNNNDSIEIRNSNIRNLHEIPAVLILANNKSYGRQSDKKNAKLLYKCIPNDPLLPAFLVPYEIKQTAFSKVFLNLYVTIIFSHWDDKSPVGTLTQTIGAVNNLEHYYDYQLMCKSLNHSIKTFSKHTIQSIQSVKNNVSVIDKNIDNKKSIIDNMIPYYPTFEDRTNYNEWKIFSIDPLHSVDFDDAFSIKNINQHTVLISIYIANVRIYIDFLNLWDHFSDRISTIYLPTRKLSMLPTILSDDICSLKSGEKRFAFTMDLTIVQNNIISIKFLNSTIKVFKNFVYEEASLLNNAHYNKMKQQATILLLKYPFLQTINDSHEVVSYFMLLMNHFTALELMKCKEGIFRTTIHNSNSNSLKTPDNMTLSSDIYNSIKCWSFEQGIYTNNLDNLHHKQLNMDAYIHITSPIRRIVDLLNIIIFQKTAGFCTLSKNAHNFYNDWIVKIDYINQHSKSIKKLQNNFSLLHACNNNSDILSILHEGIIFSKENNKDLLFQCMVYLPELKLYSKMVCEKEFEEFSKGKFKILPFENETTFKKKIRLQLIE